MIPLIAHKEFTEMIRDGRFRLSAGIVGALLLTSLVLGLTHYREVNAQHEQARRATREQWLKQGTKNPHSAAHYGIYAFKPKMPLSLVDPGVDAYTGVAAWLEAHKQNEFKYRPAQDATAVARFGELTATTVLQLLVPLLIVLLAFPAFAAERELGTLRQVMSLGVRPRDLALGKALGISAGLATLIIPATAAGALAIGFATGPGALMDDLGRLAVMAVGYLLYFGTFVGLSLAVSAWSGSSRAALIALLAFWIVNGLVAPRIAADVSKRLHPTPSALEFGMAVEEDIKNGVNGHDPSDDRAKQLEARVLKQYGVAKVEDLPVSFAGIALQEGEEYGNKVFDKHYAALWGSFERQDEIQRSAAALAPLLAMRSLSMGLAGTDGSQHREFASAAEAYRRRLVKTVNDDMTAHAKGSDFDYMATDELWAKVEDFSYSAPGLRQVLTAQWPALAVLSTWFGLSVVAAIVSTGRTKVS
jgi:ABC-2 type transport system permease protein